MQDGAHGGALDGLGAARYPGKLAAAAASLAAESRERLHCEARATGKLHARRVAAALGAEHGLVYLRGMPEREFEDSDQPQRFRQRR